MLFVGLTFTFTALAAVGFLLASLLGLALPLFDYLTGRSKPALRILLLGSVCLIGAGIFLTKRSAAHPRRDTLVYSINADEKRAKWVSYDQAPDSWTASVLGGTARKQSDPAYAAGLDRPVFATDAPLIPVDSPFVAVTQNFVSNGEQTITLQIASRRDARTFVVRLPAELKVSAAGWNGNMLPMHGDSQANVPWTFRFYNAPQEGASLEFRFPAHNGIRVWVADSTPGLPSIDPLSRRPDDTTPGYGSDVTLVAKALDL
jgi:hypothetical protein